MASKMGGVLLAVATAGVGLAGVGGAALRAQAADLPAAAGQVPAGPPKAVTAAPVILDDFSDASRWTVLSSNQVTGVLRQVPAGNGTALCLDYDYHGVSGYVSLQRAIAIDYPDNYAFAFRLRGDAPKNDLQFKLVDASGDNVWWVNRPKFDVPKAWTDYRYKKRQVDKAWGPGADKVMHQSAKVEFTIYNNEGGKGTVCIDGLTLQALPAEDTSPLTASASADTAPARQKVIADGKTDETWFSRGAGSQTITLDLGSVREFGGATIQWEPGAQASRYVVRGSTDASNWKTLREVTAGNGGTDWLALPETEARYLRFDLKAGPNRYYALKEITVQPLAFAATTNDFLRSVAKDSPKGQFPRGFTGEQPYWTILGVDGGEQQGLIGEDGALEVGRGGFSLEPFVVADGKLVAWNDTQPTQFLQDGYLPIPRVHWTHATFDLDVTAFAQGVRGASQLVSRYALKNTTKVAHDYSLVIALQPLQVNPPTQFLSTVGGVSPIRELAVQPDVAMVAGKARVFARTPADLAYASAFDTGMAPARVIGSIMPTTTKVTDATGLASGAFVYRVHLAAGESKSFDFMVPMEGGDDVARRPYDAGALQDAVAAEWRGKLDRVKITVPPAGQPLVDTLRTSLSHMLVSRIGPRLQPGTRSYSRSWIRDGAMISEGLLRMGREDVVHDYVDFYAPFQFDNGKVPCCVDDRGSDPVPENDSQGELIFNIAELYRYDGDRAFLERMWPHVQGALAYMESQRQSERTEENRALNPAFYGMMPVSISHEGYSAKPMHSYWDNFWALRGYKDAVEIARWLGHEDDALRYEAARDEFRVDLDASLRSAMAQHGIDFLPGAAELGDFDATSTTIALAPGGEQGRLPQPQLDNTFERYWTQFTDRRDGRLQWKDYTPYEWRNVAAFVRLGWRDRANEVVEFFFKDRVPLAWNQWAEVVSRTPRTPFFVGDLPHAWVGSDFVRSALDMFAYSREMDESLVLAAGIPATWLDGPGISITDLRTPQGRLSYALKRDDGVLMLDIPAGVAMPKGGLVLPWPYKTKPGSATVNGERAQWSGNELRVTVLPAEVRIRAK